MWLQTQHKNKQEALLITIVRLDCNALVGTDDEDKTSQTPTSSSDGSEDDGVDLENDNSDT